jgi:hypothetical protein
VETSWPEPGAIQPTRGRAAVSLVKAALGSFWKL